MLLALLSGSALASIQRLVDENFGKSNQGSVKRLRSSLRPFRLFGGNSEIPAGSQTRIHGSTWVRLGRQIGKGSYGTVYESSLIIDDRLMKSVALKIIEKEKFRPEEVVALRIMNNSGMTVNIYEAAFPCFEDSICIVTELMGCSLQDYLATESPLEISIVLKILSKLSFILAKLKENHIVHADIKPDNIFLTSCDHPESVVLGDFGSSYFPDQAKVGNPWGFFYRQALKYRAPEVLLKMSYSYPIDVWSVGVVMADLFFPLHRIGFGKYPGNVWKNLIVSLQQLPKAKLLDQSNTPYFEPQLSGLWDLAAYPNLIKHPEAIKRWNIFKGFHALEQTFEYENGKEILKDTQDLLFRILDFDPESRIEPIQMHEKLESIIKAMSPL